MLTTRAAKVAAAAGVACLALVASQSAAGAATVKKFTSPVTDQPFVVPDGVTSIHVVAIGGKGGKGAHNSAPGGFGAVVSADIAVTPGQTLFVSVAGNGGDASQGVGGSGGLNGGGAGGNSGTATAGKAGGGGGGLSGVRTSAGYLFSSLILASGGGGAGGGASVGGMGGGGAGGSSSVGDGKNGQSGGAGGTKDMAPGGNAGGGGTSLGPGSGAPGGGEGVGGAGENGNDTYSEGGGGGGGAGFFGGGGGGSAKSTNNDGGGGGAGSSTSASSGGTATNTSYTRDTTGLPSVTMTFDLPVAPGGGGGSGGGGGGGGNGSALALSSLKASPKAFVPAGHGGSTGGTEGMTISYSNGVAGTTTFTVLAPRSGIKTGRGRCVKRAHGKHGKRCTRYVSVGSFTHTDVAGFNTFVFTGRVRHHKLRPGKYKLQAISRADGKKSAAVTFSFRISRASSR
jgi:hypothetical protein